MSIACTEDVIEMRVARAGRFGEFLGEIPGRYPALH